jgi:hypothetical protein
MKLAIIPPLCYPFCFNEAYDNYKLILPEHWNNQGHFEATMLNHRHGGFTILDNGAAEDKPHDWDDLLKLARRCHVNEVVLPDVMGDAQGTIKAVEAVFDDTWHPTNHFGLMGVVQGTTLEECSDLVKYYLGMQGRTLTSIGLPRCLIRTVGLDQVRLLLAEFIRGMDKRIAIHLLGTAPQFIFELRDFGRDFRALNVRGVDTSAPFVYTQADEFIGDGNCRQRRSDYFDAPRKTFSRPLLQQNIDTLVRWVHG